jgi:hypothetical protein
MREHQLWIGSDPRRRDGSRFFLLLAVAPTSRGWRGTEVTNWVWQCLLRIGMLRIGMPRMSEAWLREHERMTITAH